MAERCCWRGLSPLDKMLLSPLYLFLSPQDGISLKTLSEQGVRISNKKPRKASSAGSMLYGRFVKVTGSGDVAWRAAGISLKAVLNSANPLAAQPPQPITAVAPGVPFSLSPFLAAPLLLSSAVSHTHSTWGGVHKAALWLREQRGGEAGPLFSQEVSLGKQHMPCPQDAAVGRDKGCEGELMLGVTCPVYVLQADG